MYLVFGPEAAPGDRFAGEYVESGGGVAFELEVGEYGEDDVPWVAGPGDVDGDGLADMLVGVEDSPGHLVGTSYLVPGARGLPTFLKLSAHPETVQFLGPGSQAQAGLVAPAGDFNADGFADFLIASPGNFLDDEPRVAYLVFGRPAFPGKRVELKELRGLGVTIRGTTPFGYVYGPVHETGDHDGDGVSDIVLSERGLNDIPGRVHVVYGQGAGDRFVRGDANRDGVESEAVERFDRAPIVVADRSVLRHDGIHSDGAADWRQPTEEAVAGQGSRLRVRLRFRDGRGPPAGSPGENRWLSIGCP